MAFQSPTINPAVTTPADDIFKIKNDFQQLRSVIGGGIDPDIPADWPTKSQLQTQAYTAFTTAGTAPAFTLAPSPAITALAAGQRFRVKAAAAGTTGTNSLAVSGQPAKLLKQYDAAGMKIPAVIAANQLFDVEYDGIDFVVLDPLPTSAAATKEVEVVSATVSASAMTVSLAAGTLTFRNPSLASGTPNIRTFAAPVALTIPSGATLGTVNGVKSTIAILAIDNAGTVELAVANTLGQYLDESELISTAVIATGATSAAAKYSTLARTNVPFRIVGFVESTQATAGAWATAPSMITGHGAQTARYLDEISGPKNETGTIDQVMVTMGPDQRRRLMALAAFTAQLNFQVKDLREITLRAGTSYTPPPDVKAFLAVVLGATGAHTFGGIGGSGGPGYSETLYTAPLASSYSYTIGAAGGLDGGNGVLVPGGTTTFAGMSVSSGVGSASANGTAGGVATGGSFNANGGAGGASSGNVAGGGGASGSRAGNGGNGGARVGQIAGAGGGCNGNATGTTPGVGSTVVASTISDGTLSLYLPSKYLKSPKKFQNGGAPFGIQGGRGASADFGDAYGLPTLSSNVGLGGAAFIDGCGGVSISPQLGSQGGIRILEFL